MNLLVRLVVNAIAIVITTYLLRGIHVDGFPTALLTAVVLALINVTIKPLLFILTLPITIVTLGLFTLVINALLIQLTATIVPGFKVDNFGWALLFSIVLTAINYILYKLIEKS